MVKYIPKQGDIIYLDLNPAIGHEQKGKRLAIIVSTDVFNQFTKMALICPITTNTKDFPTHYCLEDTKKIHGSVLCEYIKSIDYNTRNIKFVEKASDNDLLSIMMLMNACIEE